MTKVLKPIMLVLSIASGKNAKNGRKCMYKVYKILYFWCFMNTIYLSKTYLSLFK